MNYKKEIISGIKSMAYSKSEREVFSDWIKCGALSMQNALNSYRKDEVWKKREDEYLRTINKYEKPDRDKFAELLAILVNAFEDEIKDYLGEIFTEMGFGEEKKGQFFTPFDVSRLCAEIVNGSPTEQFTISDCCCGSGGMIIAQAKVLHDKGINYQKYMDATLQDISWDAVYMAYIQLTLLGIKGVVVQGDTLAEPYSKDTPKENIFVTAMKYFSF